MLGEFACKRCPVGYYEDQLLNMLGMVVNCPEVTEGARVLVTLDIYWNEQILKSTAPAGR